MPLFLDMLLPLAQNISLFALFAAALSLLRGRLAIRSPLLFQLATGLMFGVGAILAMAAPVQMAQGIIFDGRNIVIVVATAIGGPLAGAVCTAVAGLYRWQLGGAGVFAALPSMVAAFGVAAGFRAYLRARGRPMTPWSLGLLGILVGLTSVAAFFLMPDPAVAWRMFESAAAPLLLLTPAGTCIAGALALWMEQRDALGAQLAKANQRLELALIGSQDGILDYDLRTGRMWTSIRYREMRGYADKPEDTGIPFWCCLLLSPDKEETMRQFGELKAGLVDRIDVIGRTRHADGRILHLRSRMASHKDESGKVVRIVGFSSDETLRVEAETRLRNAIAAMDSGFAYFDADDRLVVCNEGYIDPGTRERLGNPVGHTFEEIMRGFAEGPFTATAALNDREGWLRWRTEQHRHPPERALEIQWTDGRWFNVLERRTPDGGTVGIWSDITWQKDRERELQASRDRLEQQAAELAALAADLELARAAAEAARTVAELANLEKSRFLTSMSHELRTPLNAIVGFSDVLRSGMFGPLEPPRYAEYATLINDSGHHLLSLINDVLDLSKVEAGRMALSAETLSAEEVCRQAIGLTAEMATRKGVIVAGGVQPGTTILHGDQRAVKQILLNLLSNAIKFTEPGGRVDLHVSATPDGGVLKVTDTGIGMDAAEMETALEPYGQVNSPLTTKSLGTGLGLPLAKALAELHGGRLVLASEKGVGTSIVVMLPWNEKLALDQPDAVPVAVTHVRLVRS